jgi:uncharacterized protein YraI
MLDASGEARDAGCLDRSASQSQSPASWSQNHMTQHRHLNRSQSGLRRLSFRAVTLFLLLCVALTAAACSAPSGGSGSAESREAALRQIATDYAANGDLAQAQARLDKLNLANPGQLLVSLAEADIAAGRAREEVEASARLAEMLGARSQKVVAYLSPSVAPAPTSVLQPAVLAATIEPPATETAAPPTDAPTATSVPPTATEPPAPTATVAAPTSSPTPEPQNPRVIADGAVNLRGGPGKAFPVIGRLAAGQEVPIIARNESGDWWQIEYRGAQQAWVAGTVIRVLGAIDTVAVAQNIPSLPTAAPRPTAAPQPTAAPVAQPSEGGVNYKIIETRMLNINENGGCMGKHNFYVQVVDAAGVPINGALVGRVWAPQETAITGQKDCFWNIGVLNEGCAHFDVYNASDNVLVLADPVLGPVKSQVSRTLTTKDSDQSIDDLMATGYCTEGRENCEWRKNPGGNLPPQLCGGHYSWFVKFQRTR